MKTIIIKLIRTVIGLPFVLIIWLVGSAVWSIPATVCFVVYGRINDTEILYTLTLPYQFIKKVWGKK